jgi:ketosteroid isomerase-like protein
VKHWRFQGKHTGDFFGIPATGKNLNIEGVTLVKMKNGKILQEQDFMDNSIFLAQLGLTSDPNNMTLVDNLYKAFAVGDIPSVLGGLDPHIIWNEAEGNAYADGNPYHGPEAIVNGVFARIGAEHEYFNLKDIVLHEMSDNKVLATLRYDAKYKEGKPYDAQVAHLWTLKDGKAIAFQQYVDTKKLHEALNK